MCKGGGREVRATPEDITSAASLLAAAAKLLHPSMRIAHMLIDTKTQTTATTHTITRMCLDACA